MRKIVKASDIKVHLSKIICVQSGKGGLNPVYVLIDTDTIEME